MTDAATYECPSEIHIMENSFNPGIQGPYGPGYFGSCRWCNDEFYITEDVYEEFMEWRKLQEEWTAQQALIDKIMSSTKTNLA